jgi:hypothetical protein
MRGYGLTEQEDRPSEKISTKSGVDSWNGTYLLFQAEISPYIVLSLRSFKHQQVTAYDILRVTKSRANVLL